MLPADGESGPGYMFYATPAQKADPSMYAGHYPSGLGLNQPTSEAMNASANHDATGREMIAKQTLGAAAGAGAIVLAPKVDLSIESLQERSSERSRDISLGGSVTAGLGVSGSVSFSQQN
jgi:hypothetical protein